MRYVEGEDLKTLLRREGKLSPERALRICSQVADALDAAHRRGLVHRDVKPANVLLDESGDAYLADFGLTKQVGGASTETGQLVGTLDYLAPEQIRGEDVDGRTDEYALACVLYECLDGQPPFRRSTEAELLWAHMQEPAPALAAYPSLDPVFARALAKEKDDRYESAAAFCEAAAQALGMETPRLRRRRRLLRRSRLLVAAGVLVLAGAVAALTVELTGGGSVEVAEAAANSVVAINPRTNRVETVDRGRQDAERCRCRRGRRVGPECRQQDNLEDRPASREGRGRVRCRREPDGPRGREGRRLGREQRVHPKRRRASDRHPHRSRHRCSNPQLAALSAFRSYIDRRNDCSAANRVGASGVWLTEPLSGGLWRIDPADEYGASAPHRALPSLTGVGRARRVASEPGQHRCGGDGPRPPSTASQSRGDHTRRRRVWGRGYLGPRSAGWGAMAHRSGAEARPTPDYGGRRSIERRLRRRLGVGGERARRNGPARRSRHQPRRPDDQSRRRTAGDRRRQRHRLGHGRRAGCSSGVGLRAYPLGE